MADENQAAESESDNTDETASFDVVTSEAEPTEQSGNSGESEGETSGEAADAHENSNADSAGAGNQNDTAADDTGAEKPKGRFQKRIDRLTKQKAEAERRAEEAERKLQSQSSGDAQSEGEAPTQEPDPSEFDSYDDYLDALAAWKGSQSQNAEQSSDEPNEQQGGESSEDQPDQEVIEAMEDMEESFSEARKQHDDFDEVMQQEDLAVTRDMVIALADADDPGAVVYWLGKHKDEAARIAGLSPIQQARELGKLETTLDKKPAKRTTNAPEPIQPVKGSSAQQKDEADMDFTEFEQARNQQSERRGFW